MEMVEMRKHRALTREMRQHVCLGATERELIIYFNEMNKFTSWQFHTFVAGHLINVPARPCLVCVRYDADDH